MLNKTTSLPARFPLSRGKLPTILGVVLNASAIWRERQVLADLDDHLLSDIGLTRTDVELETNRPVWDAPNRWLR